MHWGFFIWDNHMCEEEYKYKFYEIFLPDEELDKFSEERNLFYDNGKLDICFEDVLEVAEKILTKKQLEVFNLLSMGKNQVEISIILNVNQSSVSRCYKLIRKKILKYYEKYA
jgi:predicted XRE-type DNA-binding protein